MLRIERSVENRQQILIPIGASRTEHLENSAGRIMPGAIAHQQPHLVIPGKIGDSVSRISLAAQVVCRPENWVFAPQSNQFSYRYIKVFLPIHQVPVKPGSFIVLAIGVIVTSLGAGKLVTRQNHGGPRRNHYGGEQIERGSYPGGE